MNWYRIDFDNLVLSILPPLLRKKTIAAFVTSAVRPIAELHRSFRSLKKDVEYKLRHNSQVRYLQAVLNDQFDSFDRRIYIADAEVQEWARFLWREADDKPIILAVEGCFMLNKEGFIGSDSIDFVVYVPKALGLTNEDRTRMHAYLRNYKLAGKRYLIQEKEI